MSLLLTVVAAQPGGHLLQETFLSSGSQAACAALVPALRVSLISTLPEGRPGGLQVSPSPWEGPDVRPLGPGQEHSGRDTRFFPPASGEEV